MKIDPYKLLILRKAGFTQIEVAHFFGCTTDAARQVERKWRNNGIPRIDKVVIDSAEVYGAEKALDLLALKQLVDKFVKERDKNNGPKRSNAVRKGVASNCVHYKEYP